MTVDTIHADPLVVAARKVVDGIIWSYGCYVGYARQAEVRIDPLTDTPENVAHWTKRASRMQEVADGLRDELTRALNEYAITIANHTKETP